jgi:hypothetical protein
MAVWLRDGDEGLQLKFLAPLAVVVTFYDSVALDRFFDLLGYSRGFLFRPERFPIERRVGCPATMVVNAQLYGFYFLLSVADIRD